MWVLNVLHDVILFAIEAVSLDRHVELHSFVPVVQSVVKAEVSAGVYPFRAWNHYDSKQSDPEDRL